MSKLTPEQAKAMLADLFALPDKEKAKPKPKEKVKVEPKGITPARRMHGTTPVYAVVELVTQTCTTCGGVHEHVRSRRVRFEEKTGAAFEYATVVASSLPRVVDQKWETTEVCPTCVRLSPAIEDFFAAQDGINASGYRQMELFHG